jgi:two-component system chemotaxis response regulator CheY
LLTTDADTRTLYALALPIAGCEVVQASDGRDALTQALTETPTLIITELRLPLIGGIELCEIIRRDAATHSVPILVVTSETRPTERDRIRNAGATAVLVKPTLPNSAMLTVSLCGFRRRAGTGEERHPHQYPTFAQGIVRRGEHRGVQSVVPCSP